MNFIKELKKISDDDDNNNYISQHNYNNAADDDDEVDTKCSSFDVNYVENSRHQFNDMNKIYELVR